MQLSPEAEQILRQVRSLRAARQRKLECDLHFIDAKYDRTVRRTHTTSMWNRHYCSCVTRKPFCMRRFCVRRVRWLRQRLRRTCSTKA